MWRLNYLINSFHCFVHYLHCLLTLLLMMKMMLLLVLDDDFDGADGEVVVDGRSTRAVHIIPLVLMMKMVCCCW